MADVAMRELGVVSGAQEGDKLHKEIVATEADSMHCAALSSVVYVWRH